MLLFMTIFRLFAYLYVFITLMFFIKYPIPTSLGIIFLLLYNNLDIIYARLFYPQLAITMSDNVDQGGYSCHTDEETGSSSGLVEFQFCSKY